MKNNKKRIFILVIAFVISSLFAFSSCTITMDGVSGARINDKGELILTYESSVEENLGVVSNNSTTVVVENSSGDASVATSTGLSSAVTITSNFEKTVKNSYGGFPGFGGSGGSTIQEYSAEGSGVIYKLDRESGSAFIITNYHVVYDSASNTDDGISDNIDIYLYGREYESYAIDAEYVGGSLYYDIAVLYVENCDQLKIGVYNEVTVSDSDKVYAGDTAIAIGNPQGYGISTSLGIVSVSSEYITMTTADESSTVSLRVMRVDTAVNSGNSGGGLFNNNGELIGIVNAKIVSSTVENIAYAIPVNVAVNVADNIIDNCFGTDNRTVMRALLGITVGIQDSYAVIDETSGNIAVKEVVGISEIAEDSIASGVLSVGDRIVSFTLNGETKEVTRRYHIIDGMLDGRVGDEVVITVVRDGETIDVKITITEDAIVKY